jgi:hypothetical protein
VFNRAWILPAWWECMAKQTLQPDGYLFTLGESTDDTKAWLTTRRPQLVSADGDFAGSLVVHSRLPVFTRQQRQGDPNDLNRARHMSALRNELRHAYAVHYRHHLPSDLFVSLDTDILLTDPTALERMVDVIKPRPGARWDRPGEFDVAAPLVALHPHGFDSGCFNAGWWVAGNPGDYQRAWHRAGLYEVYSRKTPVAVDIPMGAYATRRHVIGACRYKEHESGEDMGFADSLGRRGYTTGWLTDVRCPHVWGPSYLEEVLDGVHAGRADG